LNAGDVPEAATRLAVLPFHATGSDDVREFGIGMVDLLTTALSDVGGIRTVSSRTVLARTGAKGGAGPTLDESLDIGRSLGAGSVLTGSITAFGEAVRLTAEIHAVDGGVLARA
jgi:TolB-like protein